VQLLSRMLRNKGRVVPCNSLISVRRNAELISLVLLAFIVLLLVEGYGQGNAMSSAACFLNILFC
jgi:hypothetical protein